ncbi:hypothetical protein FB45DRAFT_1030728 [Roridomyces roridus]|uniref:Uncharacterized protein n=1 Tax=Roridomyces roridus TaxID=1738132 RepID=A0AAD7FKP0_9AGAR|nr:hypothetical protein FB45DRAFT_1030728 [Roridomyces roridus]
MSGIIFKPFEDSSQFYPGLVVWCDPNCPDMDITLPQPASDHHQSSTIGRELKPCLVVSVDRAAQTFRVAHISAQKPIDTRQWVQVGSNPRMKWRMKNAWMWVGEPPSVAMIFNDLRAQHPHMDEAYNNDALSTSNLSNYWVHRQNHILAQQTSAAAAAGKSIQVCVMRPGLNVLLYGQSLELAELPNMAMDAGSHLDPDPARENPVGFTEQHPLQGWWRNPATGWWWHAQRGFRAP